MPAEAHAMPLVQLLGEVALWALPAALGWWLWHTSARGARSGWLLVAVATTVICIDKAIDLQVLLLPHLQRLAHWIDPESSRGGRHAFVRIALVAGAALAGVAALWLWLRTDRQRSGPKLCAFAGLCGVLGWLAIRQLSSAGFGDVAAWTIELSCWALVLAGELWGLRRG